MAYVGQAVLGLTNRLLAAGKGSRITLEIEGPDEEQAMEAICALVADCFGEGQ